MGGQQHGFLVFLLLCTLCRGGAAFLLSPSAPWPVSPSALTTHQPLPLAPPRARAQAAGNHGAIVSMAASSNLARIGDLVTALVVESPLYPVFKAQAIDKMKQTAAGGGIDWDAEVKFISGLADWDQELKKVLGSEQPFDPSQLPDYYTKNFHAYEGGNLCWDSAFEQLTASKAVGVRNFPEYAADGESHMRELYEDNMLKLGAYVEEGGTIVDFGCGTGTSARRLSMKFPQASKVIGVDLSPYFVAVGQKVVGSGFLPEAEEQAASKVEMRWCDMTATGLPENSASLVSVSLVIHEMPTSAIEATFKEAFRVLKPGGTLAVMEMDPEAPGYEKLRSNPMLLSLIRSTEPFLDEYFGLASSKDIEDLAMQAGFVTVRRMACTGRHFTMVAIKGGSLDSRFLPSGEYGQPDTHMVG